ncbi:TetR/AcrR family transcriptional regulator [Rhodococcoides fascians]|uniref:TetR/AcrR family transcriptional regulator n=1 Tax=Rhodococcoides fascians TaxID=1828 RepID=UPI0005640583|nr:TetR/AcrR family transcriptional regulator [Rhodococcus fascians]
MSVIDSDRTGRFDRTREHIIDISAGLFARNGFAATGVAELGEAVGLARGALYYYIKSKDSLLLAIHDRVMDPLLETSERISKLDAVPAARLCLMSEILLQLIIEHNDHVWVFLHEHRQLTGENLTNFLEKRSKFEQQITNILEDGVKSGDFDIPDVRATTLAWLNLHNYTYHWAGSEPDVSVARLSAVYMRMFLKGISKLPFPFEDLGVQVVKGRRLFVQTAGSA